MIFVTSERLIEAISRLETNCSLDNDIANLNTKVLKNVCKYIYIHKVRIPHQ